MAGSAVAAILTAALILVCVSLAFIKSDSLLQKVDQLSLTDPIDDALATGREFTVPGGFNDAVPRSKSGIQSAEAKLARFQSLYDDEKMSEAELAGRLSRAIDEHEKCRRHWPHLESLEAAQEIRVHDARNNLEVANRAMERARKELQDAEGLVLAARQVLLPTNGLLSIDMVCRNIKPTRLREQSSRNSKLSMTRRRRL